MNKTLAKSLIPSERIESMIYVIRGRKVILDQDLAILYNIPTGRLNEQVNRNINRFPEDFSFKLSKEEWESLKSQFAISNVGKGGRRKLPMVFTEHGVVMAANLLRSERAVVISIEVVRAFIQMRKVLASSEKFDKELRELKNFVLKHAQKSDQEFRKVWQAIEKLSGSPSGNERRIGFELN